MSEEIKEPSELEQRLQALEERQAKREAELLEKIAMYEKELEAKSIKLDEKEKAKEIFEKANSPESYRDYASKVQENSGMSREQKIKEYERQTIECLREINRKIAEDDYRQNIFTSGIKVKPGTDRMRRLAYVASLYSPEELVEKFKNNCINAVELRY